MVANTANNRLVAATVQLCSGMDVQRNLDHISGAIEKAHEQGAQLIVLPENALQMPRASESVYREVFYAQKENALDIRAGEALVQSTLQTLANRLQVYIVLGSIALLNESDIRSEQAKPTTSMLVFIPDAGVVRYDKVHLYSADLNAGESYRESRRYQGGSPVQQDQCVELPWGNALLSVCYDLRFPEFYRQWFLKRPRFIIVSAAFTVPTGSAHWKTLLQARAIENQAFVLAAAQCGEHENGRKTWGQSMVIDPWGEILSESAYFGQSTRENMHAFELGIVELDLNKVDEVRRQLPALDHRKIF